MKLILDAPDELFDEAVRIAREQMRDYRERYDRPGWGWTFWGGTRHFWVRGIKGGLSVSLSKLHLAESSASSPSEASASAPAPDEPLSQRDPP